MCSQEQCSVSKTHKRRCRSAFTAIYFTRVLLSLSKKVIDKNGPLLRTLSFVAIDMQPPDHEQYSSLFLNVDPKILSDMVREKDFDSLTHFGGVKELVSVLETAVKDGINGSQADVIRRKNAFGANKYQKPPAKSFLSFVIEALKDTTIIILLACAVLSLAFGIKQDGWRDGWYDGGSIIVAVVLVVAVSAVSNFKQSRQFDKLSTKRSDIRVEVVRGGRRWPISIFEVVVGDIVCLKIGDQIPADGLFLEGHSLKVDESSMTGESDHVEIHETRNPFLLSGTKITDGCGFMLVTSVGMNTVWGEMMGSINGGLDEETPLQARLNKLASYIGKVGLAVAALVLAVMLIRYFTGNTQDDRGNREFNGSKTKFDDVLNAVVNIVAAAVTIIVVAIPEGLPLAVTLTLAYSMKRMMADNAMVRKLSACETMGSATTICTDKTGTLTLNEMKVTEFWLGKEAVKDESSLDMQGNVLKLLQQAVGLNTTGTVYKPNSASVPEISGSPTEKAILSWAFFNLGMNMEEVQKNHEIIHVEAFNSVKKRSGVLVKSNSENTTRTHWKGAAEMILTSCSSYYDKAGMLKAIDAEERLQLESIIKNMAAKSLRCIAFAYKEMGEESRQVLENLEENGLILLGLVGMKDPCRQGVRTAVESCRAAGVNIKMITGDNVNTARAIAIECGILNPDGDLGNEAVLEGVQFRNYSPEERMEKINKISVMARSSPFDKLLMVQCLKQKGHVVAVTGDGTNDAPALKEADIGLSMGIQGTEVAKESSDIVILDDNFESVVTVLRWGRCVYNNIQKFLQFQLTVNVAALVINFVAAVSSGKIPLTAVQLLWVNLIMDTLGALALATEKPSNDLMAKPPVGRSEPLITRIMWRNLTAQALYQITILLVLQFKGRSIFGVDEKVNSTLIFNTFVFCQVFNEFNARKLERKNIFTGLLENKLFLAIIGITIVLQSVMVEILKRFANTERLDWGQWGACIGLAALSWPIGWLVKCIPVSPKLLANQRASAS
ncbi:putative calcium-transporting ATPase 13, plasma membrane-type [Alnus glutinosa]|uniref:putative calcium-transporting ATPase 13, plasma membrane-type n=1 Tax=Alnus glutinosa TaxID=3517 RepID=UPI002D76E14A|nr:putative calcium-transporting ATPase 13, plasma membrane-type [Alnus glutinosa]